MPGMSFGAVGAAYGLVVQIYANSLRRVPALRRMSQFALSIFPSLNVPRNFFHAAMH